MTRLFDQVDDLRRKVGARLEHEGAAESEVEKHERPWDSPAAARSAPVKPSACDGGPPVLPCRPVKFKGQHKSGLRLRLSRCSKYCTSIYAG